MNQQPSLHLLSHIQPFRNSPFFSAHSTIICEIHSTIKLQACCLFWNRTRIYFTIKTIFKLLFAAFSDHLTLGELPRHKETWLQFLTPLAKVTSFSPPLGICLMSRLSQPQTGLYLRLTSSIFHYNTKKKYCKFSSFYEGRLVLHPKVARLFKPLDKPGEEAFCTFLWSYRIWTYFIAFRSYFKSLNYKAILHFLF